MQFVHGLIVGYRDQFHGLVRLARNFIKNFTYLNRDRTIIYKILFIAWFE